MHTNLYHIRSRSPVLSVSSYVRFIVLIVQSKRNALGFERLTLLAIYRWQTYLSRGLVTFFLCAIFGIDTFRLLYSQTWLCSRYVCAQPSSSSSSSSPACICVFVCVSEWVSVHMVLDCAHRIRFQNIG